jgi:phosphoribosylformylglycinamidine (FGAM) synthase-like enzyme
MIYKLTTRLAEQWNPAIEGLRRSLALPDLALSRDYYVEVEKSLDDQQLQTLKAALADGVVEQAEIGVPLREGSMVQVAYKRGIVDNENDSIVDLCRLLGISATAGKVATTYQSSQPSLLDVVRNQCCNPNIEEVHETEPNYDSLAPTGHYEPMQTFDLRGLDADQLAEVGTRDGRNLNPRQMEQIRTIQLETGAPHVTDTLLEAMDARWSDHCSHTTWKSLGNLLGILIQAAKNTKNPNIVSMFHDNAGVWDFYDGHCIAFKAETHNGPSAISAYFGQLTKLGGVLRDVLGTGKGADPIGVFEYTATGPMNAKSPIPGRPSPRRIALETIRAIKEYGNTFGTPMMWSHMTQHSKYRAKPFALGGCIGIVPKEFAERGKPQPGDHVVLIGGLTGNDGIHGASASSAGSAMDSAAVQIGSPLEQVKFRQAIIDLRDAGCIRALTDVGGAGLNSAIGEIGEECGVWLNTALVPLKTAGLPKWRILLSESQERMVLATIPEKHQLTCEILDRHRVRHTVVGRFTDSNSYCVVHDPTISEAQVVTLDASNMPLSGEVGLNVPYKLLVDRPEPKEVQQPKLVVEKSEWPEIAAEQLADSVNKLVIDPEFADQTYAGSQYDSTVQGHAYYGPYYGERQKIPTSYSAITPLFGHPGATVFSVSFNPWLSDAHPVLAARQAFLAILTSHVLAGVSLKDICLCDNFYTPHREVDADYWLVGMVKELAALVELFGTPLISGKDSSAGSVITDEGVISVPPAVFLSGLGKIPDCSRLLPNEWQSPGNLLVRIGPDCNSLAGTVAQRIFNTSANDVDDVSLEEHRTFLQALGQVPSGTFVSGAPLNTGGIVGRLLLGALASELGVELRSESISPLSDLFKEHRCGALVEIPADRIEEIPEALRPKIVARITDEESSVIINGQNILSDEVTEAWANSYEESLR